MVAGNHHLLVVSWNIASWPGCRPCEGKCSFLCLFLSNSESKPSCFLAAFDMRRSDLAVLLCKICIIDCKLLVKGVLWYIIKLLKGSLPSSFCLVEHVFHNLDKLFCQSIGLQIVWGACNVIDTLLFHHSCKRFCSVAWSIFRNQSILPAILREYQLALTYNMLSCHGW